MTRDLINVLVAVHGRVDVEALRSMIESQPRLSLAGVIDNDRDWNGRSGYAADVLLIACGAPSGEVLTLISQETADREPHPIVVLCGGSPNGFVQQVFEAGGEDILPFADLAVMGPQVLFAIEKALTRRVRPAIGEQAGGDIICVLGPKGGTGKTLTASNLAVALAQHGKRVALVDLDLQFGDLGLVMGLTPERSIFDLVTSGGSLDAPKLEAFLSRHSSGVEVLLAPTRPDQASAITPEFLRDLYAVMRTQFDFVIVDTPPGFTAEVIATVDAAAGVCLIGTLDAPSLKNAKLGAETLELMGYPLDRIRVVLNRADSKVGVSHADVVTVLGRAPDVLVPSSREVVRSVNAGEPIVLAGPRSEAAKAFDALATIFIRSAAPKALGGIPVAEPRRGLRSMVKG
jgi:pilus assembly protein CpaE